jgi:hypothetical protein
MDQDILFPFCFFSGRENRTLEFRFWKLEWLSSDISFPLLFSLLVIRWLAAFEHCITLCLFFLYINFDSCISERLFLLEKKDYARRLEILSVGMHVHISYSIMHLDMAH